MRPAKACVSRLTSFALLGALLLLPATAQAAHDDSTLVALRVTVGSVDPGTGEVTITVSATGLDSDNFYAATGAFLGNVFLLSNVPYTLVTPDLPAIDWGDGSTISATNLTFTGTDGTVGEGLVRRTYSRQFSHTYTSAGNFTIQVGGMNVYAGFGSPFTITSGNPVYANTWRAHTTGSATTTLPLEGGAATDTSLAVTNTATVDLSAVPAIERTGLGILALLLAAAGVTLLAWRR